MEWEFHPEMFLVTPLVAFSQGECEDTCKEQHYRISLGWLCLSLHFYLNEH
jgi:hypothetical protein